MGISVPRWPANWPVSYVVVCIKNSFSLNSIYFCTGQEPIVTPSAFLCHYSKIQNNNKAIFVLYNIFTISVFIHLYNYRIVYFVALSFTSTPNFELILPTWLSWPAYCIKNSIWHPVRVLFKTDIICSVFVCVCI
jgi:hypothetical protein